MSRIRAAVAKVEEEAQRISRPSSVGSAPSKVLRDLGPSGDDLLMAVAHSWPLGVDENVPPDTARRMQVLEMNRSARSLGSFRGGTSKGSFTARGGGSSRALSSSSRPMASSMMSSVLAQSLDHFSVVGSSSCGADGSASTCSASIRCTLLAEAPLPLA